MVEKRGATDVEDENIVGGAVEECEVGNLLEIELCEEVVGTTQPGELWGCLHHVDGGELIVVAVERGEMSGEDDVLCRGLVEQPSLSAFDDLSLENSPFHLGVLVVEGKRERAAYG